MNILNISSIIPLQGLRRENDIVLRIQDYLVKNYDYKFVIAKSLPYVPFLLSFVSEKWEKYRSYQIKEKMRVQGYETIIYPWLMLPTSNFWINYFLIPFNWIWFKLVVDKRISEKAREADLVIAQNLIPDAINAYWLHVNLSIPYIINIRGRTNILWYKLPLLKSVIDNASQVITHSPTNYRLFKDSYDIQLVPHPVDDIFYFDGVKKYHHPKLVSVCRLLSLKNIDMVLNVLNQLKNEKIEFSYRIIGDGPELQNLKQLVIDLNLSKEVSFEGFVDRSKVAEYLESSNIFIMPSYPETLGRAFLEAAASGCLIIGHKNTGIDGLLSDGKSAILVDKYSINRKVKKLLYNFNKDLITSYVFKSIDIVDGLRWEYIGEKYNILYTDIVNND